jgi:hypothetical protein
LAAGLLAARYVTAVLWLALVLLAATFLAVRNACGVLAVLVTTPGVCSRSASTAPRWSRPASPT